MSYALHAVIIHKLVPLEEAKRISRDFIKGNRYFFRETSNSYRFRNIPKTKFINKSFRSKKINDYITLNYGELKPEFENLKGSGLIGDLWGKVKNKYNEIKDKVRLNPTLGVLGYRWCGPNTIVNNERTEPLNRVDASCKNHDLKFDFLEKSNLDRETKKRLVRQYDNEMIDELNSFQPKGLNERLGHFISKRGIQLKKIAEDVGLLNPLQFTGGKRGGCYDMPKKNCRCIIR